MKKKGVVFDRIIEFEQHHLYPDLEIIPTPGHTTGALSYLWTSGRNRATTGNPLMKLSAKAKTEMIEDVEASVRSKMKAKKEAKAAWRKQRSRT